MQEDIAVAVRRRPNGILDLLIAGRLSIAAVVELRRLVHKCAAEMPAGLIIDLNGVTEIEPFALLAVPALQSYCATVMPPFPLVVQAAPESLAAVGLRSQFGAAVAVFPDSRSASGYTIAAAEPWPTARLFLRCHPGTIGWSGEFAERICRAWLLPWVGHRAQLVANELVANAVAYAPGPARLTISLSREWLRISVQDGSSRLPTARLGAPSPDRGLGVVELVSLRWGTFLLRPGKAVWADISLMPD